MSSDSNGGCALGIVCVALLATAVFFAGCEHGQSVMRQEAVDHWAAQWVPDQKTGKVRFQWNQKKQAENTP